MSMNRQDRDYRGRRFYRLLYNAWWFDFVLFAWRIVRKRLGRFISRGIGLAYALTHPATVTAIRSNVALLAPEKASFRTACRLLMNQAECFSIYGELAAIQPEKVMGLLAKKEGFQFLKQAHEEGKGCLLVTGHLGFFELGGLVMRQMDFPMTALTQPEPSPGLTQWRADFRARWGVNTIVVGDDAFSVVEIARTLRNGGFVAMLADRPYNNSNSIPVECPYGHMLFSGAPVLISLISGCPIIPVGVTTQSDGKFQITAQPPINPKWLPEGREQSLAHYTRQIAKALIPMFKENPDQWYHFSPLGCTASSGSSLKPASIIS